MDLQSLGLSVIFLGILLVFLGMILMVLGSVGRAEWGGGLVVFVGPIPIAVGGGRLGKIALLIAVLLAIAMMLMIVISYRMGLAKY
ncbi:MAG: DUF131 domain-containing protein [Crenarchaeota archaeon]|nr:DUF131 domain-containing protein [Thermoproteota archaeon]